MLEARARDARAEASGRLGGGRVGLVLEPSPPVVNTGPWFADDPVHAVPDVTTIVVSPVSGDMTWQRAIDGDAALAAFARDHWLANLKQLNDAPPSLHETRSALTALAFNVLAPARQQANGKIGLRWTKGGFGTPFFGDDRQVRVEDDRLVLQSAGTARAQPITTVRSAATFVGVSPGSPVGIEFHDPPPPVPLDELLRIERGAIAFLDDWFGYGTHVLERLRVIAGSPDDTRVQLWPEHFDLSIELGDATHGARASYGASPGDAVSPSPYLYVSPWEPHEGSFWDAPFGGAALPLERISTESDQVGVALAFFQEGLDLLVPSAG